jgi:multidrug resistance efflux pump
VVKRALTTMFLLILLALSSLGADPDSKAMVVERKDFVKHLLLSGDLQAVDSFVVTVPRIWRMSNLVISYLAPEGTVVQAGDILVQFDQNELLTLRLEYEKAVEDARIKIAQTEADLEVSRQDLLLNRADAVKNLKTAKLYAGIDESLLPREEAERYRFEFAQAEIEFEKVNERLDTLEKTGKAELDVVQLEYDQADLRLRRLLSELEKMTIRAPIEGLIIYGENRATGGKIQVGDALWRGWPLIFLPNMNSLRVNTYVYDADYPFLKEGMPAEIIFDAVPDRLFPGKVANIPEVTKPRQFRSDLRAFQMDVRLLEAELEILRPGMTALVRVPIVRDDAIVVPRKALILRSDGTAFLRKRNDPSQLIPVTVIDASGTEAVVNGDIAEGELLADNSSLPMLAENEALDWITLHRQDLVFSVAGTGTLEAEESISIGPPPLRRHWEFKIIDMAPEGSMVREGDTLIVFDPTDTERRLREEEAELRKTKQENERTAASLNLQVEEINLQLEEALVQKERAENKLLLARQFDSYLTVQEAKYEAELAQDRVDRLGKKQALVKQTVGYQLKVLSDRVTLQQARIRQYRDALEALTIKSPAAGVVVYKTNRRNEKKEIGSNVYQREIVMFVPDLETMVVKGQIAEVDSGSIQLGQPVTVTIDAIPDEKYTGKVIDIGAMFRRASDDRPVKILEVTVRLDKLDSRRMRPGMAARFQIITDRFEESFGIPLSVVEVEDEGYFVWVKGPEGPEKRRIEVASDNGSLVVVSSGLDENEEVAHRPLGGSR